MQPGRSFRFAAKMLSKHCFVQLDCQGARFQINPFYQSQVFRHIALFLRPFRCV